VFVDKGREEDPTAFICEVGEERVDWHNIVVFGKAAESCKECLKKGREVYIEGRLRIREFEAKDNGGKRQRAEIIARRVQFPRREAGGGQGDCGSRERSRVR
jgi:single-strand DNA-binding protein